MLAARSAAERGQVLPCQLGSTPTWLGLGLGLDPNPNPNPNPRALTLYQACHTLSARIKEAKAEKPGSVSMPCAQCPRASSCDMIDEFHFSLPQLVGARREALLREPSAVTLPPMNPDLDP